MDVDGFSTTNLSPGERFEAWREWFWPVFDVKLPPLPTGSFLASHKIWNLDDVLVSAVSGSPVLATREKANISRVPADHWVLGCCMHGVTKITTHGGLLEAPPGIPFLWSLGETSVSERTEVSRIQILLPRDAVQDAAPSLDRLCGTVIDSPLGRVLGAYMIALEQWLPQVPAEAEPFFGKAILSMIIACMVPSNDRMEVASNELDRFNAERIRRAVKLHLGSPSLGPKVLCKLLGISRSSLYRFFEQSGGVVHYIQRQRLEHAHALLSDPLNRQTIYSISEEICYADSASFCRAFRREFGCTPKELRAAAREGAMPIVAAPRLDGAANFAAFFEASPALGNVPVRRATEGE